VLFSQKPVFGIWKFFFSRKSIITKNTLSQKKIIIPTLGYPRMAISLNLRLNFTLVCNFLWNQWLEFDTFSFQWKVLLSRPSKAKKIVIPTLGYPRLVISLKFRVHVYPSMLFSQEPGNRVLSLIIRGLDFFAGGKKFAEQISLLLNYCYLVKSKLNIQWWARWLIPTTKNNLTFSQ